MLATTSKGDSVRISLSAGVATGLDSTGTGSVLASSEATAAAEGEEEGVGVDDLVDDKCRMIEVGGEVEGAAGRLVEIGGLGNRFEGEVKIAAGVIAEDDIGALGGPGADGAHDSPLATRGGGQLRERLQEVQVLSAIGLREHD